MVISFLRKPSVRFLLEIEIASYLDVKIDNAIVDAIKLILLIYNNFSIVKKVVNKIVRLK